MGGALLRVEDVGVTFGGLRALQGIDLAVAAGRTLAILGPNGAGKTTLFNVVAGAIVPTTGRVVLDGRDLSGAAPSRRSMLGIARTFQITQPFEHLTVRENVMVGLVAHGASMAEARGRAGEHAAFVGLGPKLEAPARTLSTGQRKRLELARAMATGPRLLLLDEVTGGVDKPSVPGLLDLVRRLREERGVAIVVVEHSMEVLTALADEAVFLDRGRIVARGTMAEVAGHEAVRRVYLGEPEEAADALL